MRTGLLLLLLVTSGCGEDAEGRAEQDGGGPPSAEDSGATRDGGGATPDANSEDAAPGEDALSAEDAGSAPDAAPDATGGGDAALPPLVCDGTGSLYVTGVTSFEFGPGQDLGRDLFPEVVFGPPKGGGLAMGSFDTVSIGNGGFVVVEFEGNAIVDGGGVDFIVFENPFAAGGDPASPFAELGTVAVSDDGVTWTEFPCTETEYPYGRCAGWHPVFANPDENAIDPRDPAVSGGDAFDLADIGVTSARFVRVTDRLDLTGIAGVFDLDAVAIVHPMCP